jgi:hypothetical protein
LKRLKKKVKGGCIESKYFKSMYENKTMKPINTVFRRREGGLRMSNREGECDQSMSYASMEIPQ